MYLWKYWRETRIAFCVGLAGIAILFVLVSREPNLVIAGNPPFNQFARFLSVAVFIQAIPVAFFAWLFGSAGVGRDLGDGGGAFLFTRPRSRAFFVWCDWGFGLALLLALVVLVNAVIGFQFYRIMLAAGDPLHGHLELATGPVSLAFLIGLDCIVVFLFAALIFSLTYFSTVLMKHSKGVILAAGILLGYLILKEIVSHYWPGIALPPVIVADFFGRSSGLPVLANHLGAFLGARAFFILLFPVATQLFLEKTDI